jgi:hypothetical protein
MLQGAWSGKLGDTVGSKWKDKKTLRSYAVPSNPDSPAQQLTRTNFGRMSKIFMTFADQLKPLTALDVKGMTVRNALVKLNKDIITNPEGDWDGKPLMISTGGLPLLPTFSGTSTETSQTITWTSIPLPIISTRAQIVAVITLAPSTSDLWHRDYAIVKAVPYTSNTVTMTWAAPETICEIWVYLLDYRGSKRVTSISKSLGQKWG